MYTYRIAKTIREISLAYDSLEAHLTYQPPSTWDISIANDITEATHFIAKTGIFRNISTQSLRGFTTYHITKWQSASLASSNCMDLPSVCYHDPVMAKVSVSIPQPAWRY
jgi:hypothetical protein